MTNGAPGIERDVAADSPLMRFSLGLAASVIALPGTLYFAWSAFLTYEWGSIAISVVCALIALLPVFASVIAVHRSLSLQHVVATVSLAGIMQMACVVVFPFGILAL